MLRSCSCSRLRYSTLCFVVADAVWLLSFPVAVVSVLFVFVVAFLLVLLLLAAAIGFVAALQKSCLGNAEGQRGRGGLNVRQSEAL